MKRILPGDQCWGVYNQRWLDADHTVTEQYNMVYRRETEDIR